MAPRKRTGSLLAATLWRLFGFLTASAVCGVLAASLLVPTVAATGVAVKRIDRIVQQPPLGTDR